MRRSPVQFIPSRAEAQLIYQRGRLGLVFSLLLLGLFAAVMLVFPGVDLYISGLYFDLEKGSGRGFYLRDSQPLKFSFDLVDWLSRAALVIAIGWAIWAHRKHHRTKLTSLVVALSLVVGPLLAVNELFKENWGRPRPRDVAQFAGSQQFAPAFHYDTQCVSNCSFPSGHAAAGFAPVVGHLVSRRRIWLWGGIGLGSLVGLSRIVVGAHFFSDVVFAFFVVFIAASLVAFVLGKRALNQTN